MWNTRPLSPGRTGGREQQREADAFARGRPPNRPGEHSVWCDLAMVERGYYPLVARGVVVVLTEEKVLLRVASTAFTFTVHVQDVVQVRHVVPKSVVELHVRLPGAAGVSAPQRLYRLAVTEHLPGMSAQLFHTLVNQLPLPFQRRAAAETFTDAAAADYLVEQPRSLLPPELLDDAGLREVEWIEAAQLGCSKTAPAVFFASPATPPPLPGPFESAPATANHPFNVSALQESRRAAASTPPAAAVSTGHLRKIYVAPSPSFWRLPKHAAPVPRQDCNLTWSSARGQASLPQAEVPVTNTVPFLSESLASSSPRPPTPSLTFPAVRTPVSYHLNTRSGRQVHRRGEPLTHFNTAQELVNMSCRESSLMADVCGLRSLAAPTSSPSSRASQQTDPMLRVEYGPILSG